MNRFILTTIALLLTVMTTACNTMQGFGTDVQDAGQYIEHAATPKQQPQQ